MQVTTPKTDAEGPGVKDGNRVGCRHRPRFSRYCPTAQREQYESQSRSIPYRYAHGNSPWPEKEMVTTTHGTAACRYDTRIERVGYRGYRHIERDGETASLDDGAS